MPAIEKREELQEVFRCGVDLTFRQTAQAAHQLQVLHGAHGGIHERLFGYVPHPGLEPDHVVPNILSIKENPARAGLDEPREHLDGRGLARAVRAEVSGDVARSDRKADVVNNRDAAVVLCEFDNLDHFIEILEYIFGVAKLFILESR
jgi:hypothetical protein